MSHLLHPHDAATKDSVFSRIGIDSKVQVALFNGAVCCLSLWAGANGGGSPFVLAPRRLTHSASAY
jgi:hypothetical protein